eukprot:9377336-Prorocentrum_lima.AAC.1
MQHMKTKSRPIEYAGIVHSVGCGWILSDAARCDVTLFLCLLFIAFCGLHIAGCIGARLATGVNCLNASSSVED